jgi:hypothetical protein
VGKAKIEVKVEPMTLAKGNHRRVELFARDAGPLVPEPDQMRSARALG